MFDGNHICQKCFYALTPIYKRVKHGGLRCLILYDSSPHLNKCLDRVLFQNEKGVAPALISYCAPFLFTRFHGFTIVPLFEDGADPNFNVAEAIFKPFGFNVEEWFEEAFNEQRNRVKTVQILKKTAQKPPNRIVLFLCSFNREKFVSAYRELRKKGVKNIYAISLRKGGGKPLR